MRINSKNGSTNKISKKFSCFKPNYYIHSRIETIDYNKSLPFKIDDSDIISKKGNSNSKRPKQSEKQLLKSKTLYLKKNIFNEKTNTLNSKSQSINAPHYESNKIMISNKQNLHLDSDSVYHADTYNQIMFFNINDNKGNKKFKIKNNKISTTKYNFISFLPKSLLLQFTRLPNIFFLFTAIIQSMPVISPLSSITAIVPLIFVLGISMIREFIEDWNRKNYDDLNNREEVIVFREGVFKKSMSQSLRIGEIIIVPEGKTIPADLILIDSGLREGIAYVETSSLDGEKALKFKLANKQTIGVFTENNNKKEINFRNLTIGGEIEICPPNPNLNEIYGKIKFFLKNNDVIKANYVVYEITNKEFILKGSILRNTNWIVGVIAYTGMNNKIILNSKKPRTKVSKVEQSMNSYLIYVFFVLIILCFVCSILHNYGYRNNTNFYNNFILIKRSSIEESFITFFTYFLLLNTMIPISLIVTLEIIKLIQGFLIEWDTKLYSMFHHVFCKARAVSIIEELGNVNFIFSDKTGTLTLNQLKFKYCLINGKCYEYKRDVNYNKTYSLANNKKLLEIFKYIKEIIPFHDNYFSNEVSNKKKILKENKYKFKKQDLSLLEEEVYLIDEFWKAIALTNECMVSEEKGDLKYIGTSPDDNELVKTACNQGYKLFSTSIDKKLVRICREGEFAFEILHVLGFSSERRRMSIIFRDKKKIKIYCKGADIEIIKRLSPKVKQTKRFEILSTELDNFSKFAYRTLMVASKIIKESDYLTWIDKIRKGEKYQKNSRLMEKLYDLIECDFDLLGGTVLEDKLQNKVPDTISALRSADIKIWVLTGDKLDTVENIGISCNLLSYNEKIFKIKINTSEDAKSEDISEAPSMEIQNFLSEFRNFLENSINNNKKNNLTIYPIKNKKNENFEKTSMNFSDLNYEYLSSLKEKNLINDFSIIIESPLLNTLFKDDELTDKFLTVAQYASTVLCCRASPFQKSQVVQKIKKFNPQAITLAIGDGRNDISMLMEANIGVGIFGEEGVSAAEAADFAIGEFKLLKRLLFFHGRANMNRISKMIIYFFYKNFIFTMTQFFFAFYNLSSGQTLMDDWYITCYNLVFTALPLCVCALTDIDIKEEDSPECKSSMPLLYKESRDEKRYFTLYRFLFTVIKSIILSCIIFLLCSLSTIIDNRGHYSNIWYMSLKNFTCILIVISINIFIETKFIVYFLPLVVIVTTFLFYFIFLFLVHYGLVFNFNSKASIFPSLSVIKFYLIILVVSALIGVIDYSIKVYSVFFVKSLKGQLELKRAMLTNDEIKMNEISNSSVNRSEMRKEVLNNDRILSYQIEGGDDINNKNNESMFDSSNMKMRNNDDLHNLNYLNKKNKIYNDSNEYFSRIYQNSSSISSSSQHNISLQSNSFNIKKNIKNKTNYNESFMEAVNNKKSDKINDNLVDIISINNNKRNKISLLRKIDNNIANNTTKNNTFVNNEKNEINNNQKTTEIMITTDLLQFNKKS